MPDASASFVTWLSERREFLRHLEKEATRVLRQENETDKYRALMSQKAQFLQALAGEAEKHLCDVPENVAGRVRERLEKFSRSASQALKLDSVFYMSALLYPEDYQEGEPNDLDRLVDELAAKGKTF